MGKLKSFSKLSAFLLICFTIHIDCSLANHTVLLEHHKKSTADLPCFQNVIPLRYEIKIGPINNSSDHVVVSCWVKIRAEIGKNYCRSNKTKNNAQIKLNSRNAKLNMTGLTISKVVIEKLTQVLGIKVDSFRKNESNNDYPEESSKYNVLLDADQVNVGDQILLFVPYEIKLKREQPVESWQGLYYYNPSDRNKTDLLTDPDLFADPDILTDLNYIEDLRDYYPLLARYIFPIIETSDPFHKPTFAISAARELSNGFVSISNTDIVETVEMPELGDGWVQDSFRESPPMKTNQVTLFILGGYQRHTIYTNPRNPNDEHRAINVWTLKDWDYGNDTIYNALFEVETFMNFFDGLFNGTEYPLNKIDFIAKPWYYDRISYNTVGSLGIMIKTLWYYPNDLSKFRDNWETYLFLSFEIASQWFDGITSPINEYNEYEWSGESLAHYVNKYVFNWGEARLTVKNEYYKLYLKILLDMIEHIMSREVMQYAICQIYLAQTDGKETFPTSLWSAIQESLEYYNKTNVLPNAAGNQTITVAEILNSWVNKQHQYPTIRINAMENQTDAIELYQEYPKGADPSNQTLWWIPVRISTRNGYALTWISPNNTKNSTAIYQNSDIIDTQHGYLFVTPNLTDYYVVVYGDQLMINIIEQLSLNHSVIPEDLITERFRLASKDWNNWNLLNTALAMTKYLDKEMDESMWQYAARTMSMLFIGKYVKQPSSFQVYFGSKVDRVLRKIGLSQSVDDNAGIVKLRSTILEVSYLYEVPLLIEHGTNLMKQWMENTTVNPFVVQVGPDMRQTLYCAAVANSLDNSVFHFLYEKVVNHNLTVKSSDSWTEAKQICKALTCARDDDLLIKLLTNDSKLATMEHQVLKTCHRQIIPFGILWRRPLTMKKAVKDFWTKFDLKQSQNSTNHNDINKILIPWSLEREGTLESIQYKSLEDQVKFSLENWTTMSITWMPMEVYEANHEVYKKSDEWFEENM